MKKYRIKSHPYGLYTIQEKTWLGWVQILEPGVRGPILLKHSSTDSAERALKNYLYLKHYKPEYTYVKNNS